MPAWLPWGCYQYSKRSRRQALPSKKAWSKQAILKKSILTMKCFLITLSIKHFVWRLRAAPMFKEISNEKLMAVPLWVPKGAFIGSLCFLFVFIASYKGKVDVMPFSVQESRCSLCLTSKICCGCQAMWVYITRNKSNTFRKLTCHSSGYE